MDMPMAKEIEEEIFLVHQTRRNKSKFMFLKRI